MGGSESVHCKYDGYRFDLEIESEFRGPGKQGCDCNTTVVGLISNVHFFALVSCQRAALNSATLQAMPPKFGVNCRAI